MAKLNWNPWMGLKDAEEETRRIMREAVSEAVGGMGRERVYLWTPAADVVERADCVVISVELPGLAQDEVMVEVRGEALWVYGERPFAKDLGDGVYQALERSYGPFARKFPLARDADRGRITAVFANGLLEVTIPRKSPETLKRRIPVS